MRAINRPGSQLLGANGRDDGPIVSFLLYQYYRFNDYYLPLFYFCHVRSHHASVKETTKFH